MLVFSYLLLNTHHNIDVAQRKRLHGRILLRRVPIEFTLALVPLDRVQCVALGVVLAQQLHVVVAPHCRGNGDDDVTQ